ncbi:hypothetical protein HTT03_05735 [Sulfitobacter sp. S0837]|uniref:protein-tyrosine phosphatase family protein n=1 Tax=Sulfitobacter maritimus TaxID=2741719 RepID=UPI001583E776|nr:hypothetical protein [Sulfitobacter maritimus]NUH64802.1 hypothetical protein [Sulfitobacter maritimus]
MSAAQTPSFDGEATSIRAVFATPRGGHIAMAGFPGLATDVDGAAYLDPAQMDETLAGLVRTGARRLLVLTEEEELPEGAFDLLRGAAEQQGLTLWFSSIRDFSVPDEGFMTKWPGHETRCLAAFERGETIALCCQYGAGRSGLTAALLLIACGMSASKAIPFVRRNFSEAIENQVQENWLRAYQAA